MGLGSFFSNLFGGKKEQGDACVACESSSLTVLADRVYRCDNCGYEGGDGLADWERQKQKERLRASSPPELLSALVKDFETARLTLLAAPGAQAGGGQGGALGGGTTTENPDGSVTTSSWSIQISAGSFGSGSSAFAAADEEERQMLIREQEAAIATARAEVLAAIPALELLVEQGQSGLQSHLDGVRAVENGSPADLAGVISTTGATLSAMQL